MCCLLLFKFNNSMMENSVHLIFFFCHNIVFIIFLHQRIPTAIKMMLFIESKQQTWILWETMKWEANLSQVFFWVILLSSLLFVQQHSNKIVMMYMEGLKTPRWGICYLFLGGGAVINKFGEGRMEECDQLFLPISAKPKLPAGWLS